MSILKTTLIAAVGMLAFVQHAEAQNCSDLYKQANALRKSKNYEQAISYYQRAKSCDNYLTNDCNKWIAWCRHQLPKIEVSKQVVIIPYQGGDASVGITANRNWDVEGETIWCKPLKSDNHKQLIVQCRTANDSIRSKIQNLMVKVGDIYKTIRVVQEGRPEYLTVGAKSLSFPAKGTEDSIVVESNAKWDVSSVPSWCKVEKKDDGIHIVVSPNERVLERTDNIVIRTPNKDVTIRIYQSAGDEHLTLSQNNLVVAGEGDVRTLKVYTDAKNWFVGDFPTWMNVQRVGDDEIRIECAKNVANGMSREGSVKIRTDRQTQGVMITQEPRKVQDLIFSEKNLVSGRNISFGVTAGYSVPIISASSGGDFTGSIMDYGLGTKDENASYKSATAFTVGAFADVRLYKNIFLTAGVNYMQVKYKNTFNKNTDLTIPFSNYVYMKGNVQNAYTEEYAYHMLEVPILASYRFKVNDVSHVQLNLGPVLNFGLSANMNLSGNTDCETMRKYNKNTNLPDADDMANYLRHTAVNAAFNLYQPCVYWEEKYTTGNDAAVPHHDVFQSAPLKKFNCGLRIGVAYEWAGLSVGLSYTQMLTNMANKNYWENERFTVLNHSDVTMKGYKQRINSLELKLAYTLRYLKKKK